MSPHPSWPEPGVTHVLARDRAARLSNLRCALSFQIPEAKQHPVRGNLSARFDLADTSAPLVLDFALPAAHLISSIVNGQTLAPVIVNGHIVVTREVLARGPNEIRIEFVAGDAALNRHDDYVYSLFVPARASHTFPCFDQPDLKACWQLMLEIPPHWEAVSNAPESLREPSARGHHLTFDETVPLPPYLVAFAAGRFTVDRLKHGGRSFQMYHRETDVRRLDRNREEIAALHTASLEWLERYTGIPYPFGKLDIVLLPAFQFAGMEHPGAVYYDADSLLLDPGATRTRQLGRADLIAHETAHMWFGNLVTIRWFDDVWIKEVLAGFMAAKVVEPLFPEMDHDLRFLHEHYPQAYGVDRTAGSNPIRQELASLDEAGSLYGAIIYRKAPIVMRQLERLVGDLALQHALRDFLRAFAYHSASWPELLALIDERTPGDLGTWNRAWVLEAGRPTVAVELETTGGLISRLALVQSDPRGRGLLWPQRLRVLVGGAERAHGFDATLAGAVTVVSEAAGLPAPDWVLPVGDGLGYGLFELDRQTVAFLVSGRLRAIPDPLTRGAAWIALWELMLEGRIAADAAFAQILESLPAETDELNLQFLLECARAVVWRFTRPEERPARASAIEPVLQDGLARAATVSARAAWFGGLRQISFTPERLGWLEAVWRREVQIPGLPLREADETTLALELALRSVSAADRILAVQRARIDNPDRQARFDYLVPAASDDETGRRAFFERLRKPEGRMQEAWVVDGLRYLHHPLHAGTSSALVIPALELVPEIARTGDIFFPKRWADATLCDYSTPDLAATVGAFIETLPASYPRRLRWLLLASADPLFRAAAALNTSR